MRNKLKTPELKSILRNFSTSQMVMTDIFAQLDDNMTKTIKEYIDSDLVPMIKQEYDVFTNPAGLSKYRNKDNEIMIFNQTTYYSISASHADDVIGSGLNSFHSPLDVFESLVSVIKEGF